MEKADRILSLLFERMNISDTAGYAKLFSTWRAVCDEVSSRGLADHSAIVDVRNGTVIVAVDHPGWLQLIQMQEKRLLGKLQKRFPDMGLQNIHFHITRQRVDEVQVPDTSPDGPSTTEKPADSRESGTQAHGGKEKREDPDDALGRISDPRLKETLERLRNDLGEH